MIDSSSSYQPGNPISVGVGGKRVFENHCSFQVILSATLCGVGSVFIIMILVCLIAVEASSSGCLVYFLA